MQFTEQLIIGNGAALCAITALNSHERGLTATHLPPVRIANVSGENKKPTIFFYHIPFNKSGAQTVKIKRLQRTNWALTLQDLSPWKVELTLSQKKCLFYEATKEMLSPLLLFFSIKGSLKWKVSDFAFSSWHDPECMAEEWQMSATSCNEAC